MAEGETNIDAATMLERAGFDAEESVLTRRQAEVLALREHGLTQSAIGDRLGTSRANVSAVERAARDNVERSRETIAFADALVAPIRVTVETGDKLYDVPGRVYEAADKAGVKINQTAPDLMRTVGREAGDAVDGGRVVEPILVGVTLDDTVRVRRRR
jgi:Tfx family DNA-binding protein